jgi:DNA-binding phage protein
MSAKRAQEPRLRQPMSAGQRAKLSATQKAYVAKDPRWPAHRQKLVDANVANRMTLFSNEIAAAAAMRKRGRTFSYIAEEIGIDRHVLRRELRANGIPTEPLKADRRARRGKGPWRSFDDPNCMKSCLHTQQSL